MDRIAAFRNEARESIKFIYQGKAFYAPAIPDGCELFQVSAPPM
jgi:hypothetical protein